MRKTLRCSSAFAALSVLGFAAAQPPPRTIEERVSALESGLATLDTRFGLQSTRPPDLGGESGVALAGRITALERSVERLTADIERVARVAETAARDAATAQRTAEQAAREAALRAR